MTDKTIFNDDTLWHEHWKTHLKSRQNLQICSRCIFDSSIRGITFNSDGLCYYCQIQEDLEVQYPGGQQGWKELRDLATIIKKVGRKQKYDVVIGVSGGADSSYMLHLAKNELGLRPLAVHFDNTWNSTIATSNIKKLTEKLDIDLFTHVVNNEEFDDSCKAFLLAGVPDLDIQTDLALAATLNRAAEKYNIKYIFEGHSFRSEGISPAGWLYMDSRYVNSVQKQFGSMKLKTLPHMWLSSQFKWMLWNRFKKIRPLWIIDYEKEACKKMLAQEYDWEWYGGHHLENRITAFLHTFLFPRRWAIDSRGVGFAGLIRSGQMRRADALSQLAEPPTVNLEIVELVKKRLHLTDDEFVNLMLSPKRSYRDFKNYKKTFETMRPFFYLMAKFDLIPWSFYIKYTAKDRGSTS